ncbi:PDZ domain-containing protein [Heliorestis acidaminivorans]|uniref:PDZ domain-containing protein n=1 Tax=Heliorestis acidaminivorans TaxID=553427 RepID=A0A6I0F246_9FIRM|nr:PDZ domain-containing protein [Heliorestis acidaminivorans]KAB2950990.1 PDZ domain-containing protein [Heliorestis acidaminivorans]
MEAFNLWNMLQLIFQGIWLLVAQPFQYPSLFWLIVILIALQYRRMAKMKAELFRIEQESSWRPILVAIAFGIFGGMIGSFLLIFFGITITEAGFLYLWPIALLLMLINTRYLCFAYAGGVLSLAAIILGWEAISVAQIMGLVAILHMVEALLIYFTGHRSSVPVYISHQKGMTVGGYNLQSFWPIPLMVLTVVAIPEESSLATSGMAMPGWWPLIEPPAMEPAVGQMLLFVPLPIVAALGYGDLAVTRPPREHSRLSAFLLGLYSLILLGLALLASFQPSLAILAALFGPLGHEALILWTQRRELGGKPFYVPSPWGLRILGIAQGSPAEKLGLQTGDVVSRVNGHDVRTRNDLSMAASMSPLHVEVEFLPDGKNEGVWRHKSIEKKWSEPIGIIAAPDEGEPAQVKLETSGVIERWIGRWKNRNRKNS